MGTLVNDLALQGGTPVRTTPLPTRRLFDTTEAEAAARLFERVIANGGAFDRYEGPEVDLLEQDLAAYFGVRHVTCVSSGTAAVHSALGALDLEPGSEVICSSFTDPGSVMPLFFMGLLPVFADHDLETTLMSPSAIEAAITSRTRAIIVTHIHGLVCDMDAIMRIARDHGLWVIGDASQAHGAAHRGSLSGPFGHIGVVSTMAWKHMTTGGQGGFVATDDEDLYWAAKRFADRGKPFGQDATSNTSVGLNYRMTELAATIGRVQLRKLEGVARRRRAIADALREGLERTQTVRAPRLLPDTTPTPYVEPFILDVDALGVTNEYFARAVVAEGIPATHHSPVIYEMDFVLRRKSLGQSFFPFGFPLPNDVTEWSRPRNPGVAELQRRLFIIKPHEHWTDADVADAILAVRKVEASILGQASKSGRSEPLSAAL